MPDPCATLDLLLMAYADGEVSPEERGRVEAHLALCERCRERLVEWRAIAQQTDRLVANVNAAYSPAPQPFPPPTEPAGRTSRAVVGIGLALCLVALFVAQFAVLRHNSVVPLSARSLPLRATTNTATLASSVPPLATPTVAPATSPPTLAGVAANTVARVPAATTTPGVASDGQIAYIRDGYLWLHSAGGDRQITNNTSATAPRWSPTGRWLLYETTGGAQPELWLFSAADASQPEPVPAPADSGLARWSPARDELAVAAADGSLWLVQPRGAPPRALLGAGGKITNLAWSPDGRQLAVERRGVSIAAQSLWRVTTAGAISGLSSEGLAGTTSRTISPNTTVTSFAPDKRDSPAPVLGTWNAAGTILSLWLASAPPSAPASPLPMALWAAPSGAHIVLPAVYPYRDSVSWSPDGRDVAVAAVAPGRDGPVDQLTVVPADGSQPPRVVSAPGRTVGDVAWSPDGALIAFASSSTGLGTPDAAGGRQIWVVMPDGNGRRALSPGPDDGYPQWSSHGDTLLFVHQTKDGAEVWTVARQGGDAHEVVGGLVGLRALPQQPFGASGLVSYRGVFSWSGAARGN